MNYTRFEWNEAKSRRNVLKHGLSLATATQHEREEFEKKIGN
jgi:uncharacterized DUF497 family protein